MAVPRGTRTSPRSCWPRAPPARRPTGCRTRCARCCSSAWRGCVGRRAAGALAVVAAAGRGIDDELLEAGGRPRVRRARRRAARAARRARARPRGGRRALRVPPRPRARRPTGSCCPPSAGRCTRRSPSALEAGAGRKPRAGPRSGLRWPSTGARAPAPCCRRYARRSRAATAAGEGVDAVTAPHARSSSAPAPSGHTSRRRSGRRASTRSSSCAGLLKPRGWRATGRGRDSDRRRGRRARRPRDRSPAGGPPARGSSGGLHHAPEPALRGVRARARPAARRALGGARLPAAADRRPCCGTDASRAGAASGALEAALAAARAAGAEAEEGFAPTSSSGVALAYGGDPDAAATHFREALRIATELGRRQRPRRRPQQPRRRAARARPRARRHSRAWGVGGSEDMRRMGLALSYGPGLVANMGVECELRLGRWRGRRGAQHRVAALRCLPHRHAPA